jgi:hypothetical protein
MNESSDSYLELKVMGEELHEVVQHRCSDALIFLWGVG